MAARTRKIRHDDETRARIQAAQLVNRLTAHALGKLKTPMEASAVTAALGLLKKSIPDLTLVDSTLKADQTVRVISDKPMTADEWERRYADLGTAAGASDSAH